MLLSAVSVLVVAQSISEISEGLMNNPVLRDTVLQTSNAYQCRFRGSQGMNEGVMRDTYLWGFVTTFRRNLLFPLSG